MNAPQQLTELGQALWLQRELDGTGNTQCPICEDEESFGSPCDECIATGRDL